MLAILAHYFAVFDLHSPDPGRGFYIFVLNSKIQRRLFMFIFIQDPL